MCKEYKESHSSAQMGLGYSTVQLYLEKMNVAKCVYVSATSLCSKMEEEFLKHFSSRLVHRESQYDHI